MNFHLYRIVRYFLKFLFKFLYRPNVIGREHLEGECPHIFVGNHTDNFDSLLLISIYEGNIRFLGKHTLFRGFKKHVFKNMGVIPVDRTAKKNKFAIESALESLKNGLSIAIFPEGTINRTDKTILPFKFGAVKIAKESGYPIVPFVIKGKYKIIKNDLRIEFLEPFYVEEEDLVFVKEKLEKTICESLERNIK